MIELQNLSRKIDQQIILSNISTSFASGKLHALCGPNGSGKTSLLRAICGFDDISSGTITIGQTDVTKTPSHARGHIVTWAPAVQSLAFEYLTSDVLTWRYPPGSNDKSDRDIMQILGLPPLMKRSYVSLSLGEQKRVQLARVLMCRAPYTLLDEPTVGLEPAYCFDLLDWLRVSARKTGQTYIFSLHDLMLVNQFSDTVTLLECGTVVQKGTPQEVFTSQEFVTRMGVELKQQGPAFYRKAPTL
jgi:ABC-type cobalamin/Fe3+-siderophores transport system ATPase subunit